MTANSEQKTASSKKPTLIRIVVGLLLTLLLVTVSVVEAQQPKKITRIGILTMTDSSGESARSEGIRLALRQLGYIERQNIIIEYRYAEGKLDRLPELAAELVRLNVDVILASAPPPTVGWKNSCRILANFHSDDCFFRGRAAVRESFIA